MGGEDPASARSETLRQAVHLAMLSFALLLRVLSWWQAALFAVAAVIPALLLTGRVRRAGEQKISGVVLYPASVLLVILLFPARLYIAAGAWAILAVGDCAANVFGRRLGRARLPWNRQKSIAGSVAMFVASLPAAAFFIWWVGQSGRVAFVDPSLVAAYCFALAGIGSFFGTIFESLPLPINDNLVIILASSVPMHLLDMAIA